MSTVRRQPGAWRTVVGLEMHARVATRSKLFCGCANRYGAAPNTLVCPVCAGLPGAMPVLNAAAWEAAVRLGVATGATLTDTCRFDRKNYFYADLPKGYQITQFDHPVCRGGFLEFACNGSEARVALERIHLEEDAGRSLEDDDDSSESCIDLNRAGTPLLEVVTRPSLERAEEAVACVRALRTLLRTLRLGDGDMEKGSLRCDVNVSVHAPHAHDTPGGERVEIKNLNSLKAIHDAIQHETARQAKERRAGRRVRRETRLWDAAAGVSRFLRRKEDEATYGYTEETDLGWIRLHPDLEPRLLRTLPELPAPRRRRFVREYGLAHAVALQLTEEVERADFFEAARAHAASSRRLANWMCNEVAALAQETGMDLERSSLTPSALGELVSMRHAGQLTQPAARHVLRRLYVEGGGARSLALRGGWLQAAGRTPVQDLVERVVGAHPDAVRRYRQGKHGVLDFLVGRVMRASAGRADPELAQRLLRQRLDAP